MQAWISTKGPLQLKNFVFDDPTLWVQQSSFDNQFKCGQKCVDACMLIV